MIMWNVFSQTMTVGLNPAALPEGIGRGFNADYPDQLSAHLVVRNDGESNPRQRLYGPNYRGYYFLPYTPSWGMQVGVPLTASSSISENIGLGRKGTGSFHAQNATGAPPQPSKGAAYVNGKNKNNNRPNAAPSQWGPLKRAWAPSKLFYTPCYHYKGRRC